uniref:Uncharacterized protein n=1 Tax=Nelumbo nucifera TaxID=4432 RepID=A0A822YQ05_NELNU|nr:TPA_asm: hypothetical protein HUJ06_012532 [Nelumbo nucifera]
MRKNINEETRNASMVRPSYFSFSCKNPKKLQTI